MEDNLMLEEIKRLIEVKAEQGNLEVRQSVLLEEEIALEERLDGLEEAGNQEVIAWRTERIAKRKAKRKAEREKREAERLAKQQRRVYEYGAIGVDAKIYALGKHSEITDAGIYYGSKEHCAPTYVVVRCEDGCFVNLDGVRVRLVSINGHGEIRWTVEPRCPSGSGDVSAIEAFGLARV